MKPVELGNQFALFVEESPAIGAGVAIFKPDASPNVELRIRDEEGNDPLNGVFIPWENFHQKAGTLPEWLGVEGVDTGFLSDFRGLLFIRSENDTQFAPLGLRFGKTSRSLSSVPAIRILDGDGIGGGQAPPPTVTLSVAPSSIDWGESATLTWSSTNAASAEIVPDIGEVLVSGSRKVSPRTTTTYRISVRSTDGQTETASVTVQVVISEQAALTALYEFTGGPDWNNSGNWGTGRPLGEWHGITVDDQGRVTKLILTANGLSGAIPPELGALTHLTTLDLRDNALTGPIPAELGALVNLTHLVLDNNELTGPIPPHLGSLVRLEALSLRGNALTGPIPSELGSLANLKHLVLNNNSLAGLIPPELGALSNLTYLGLAGNNLTGPIPPELGSLSDVTSLSLRSNLLTGPIPTALRSLSNLKNLDLRDNALTGPIPPELGALANLELLWLYHNELTGTIPPQLGSLAKLTSLWLGANALSGPIPPELGALTNLEQLVLTINDLEGMLPPEIGSLAHLRLLHIRSNRLQGPVPHTFLGMDLQTFWYGLNDGLCAPGDTDFVTWLKGIEQSQGDGFCNDSDRAVLKAFFEISGGSGWTNSDGWGGEGLLEEWYGVSVDSQGRVTGLDLSGNGLEGRIAGNLGRLSQLTELKIGGNALSGRLPLSLSFLPALQEFHYGETELCVPTDESFRTWIGAIPSHEGTAADCPPPSDRDLLVALYDATGGPQWRVSENWLTDRPLEEWHGVEVDDNGSVTALRLQYNNLTGPIPPDLVSLTNLNLLDLTGNKLTGPIPAELGSLTHLGSLELGSNRLSGPIPSELGSFANLRGLRLSGNRLTGVIPAELASLTNLKTLWLHGNALTGSIPPQLGALANLTRLLLQDNGLTGPIPAELGSLADLRNLDLGNNELNGSIPPELGGLSNLESLRLEGNSLAGSVPPEIGGLTKLEHLRLQDNKLTGTLPPEFGGLENLTSVVIARNGGLSGPLPARLTDLRRLEELLAADTNLCAPSDAGFQNWLSSVPKHRVGICGATAPPAAYLTQTVQSRDHPVPLVAGDETLLRVFVVSSRERGAHLPPVRATFYRNGASTHVVDIPGKPVPIPQEIREGDLTASANAQIPGWVVQPGLEMVIDVDPAGTLGPDPGVMKRIPESGRLTVDVRTMPVFELTMIPFLWTSSPDSSIEGVIEGMTQDPGGHALLSETRNQLPINELDVKAHAPVWSSTNNAHSLLHHTEMIRVMEGAGGHYMGMMAGQVAGGVSGVAKLPGWATFSRVRPLTVAHELGHNLNLYHAPCGNPGFVEPSFPGNDGRIGAWGYDFSEPGRLLPPVWPDLMSYCRLSDRWIGEYHLGLIRLT